MRERNVSRAAEILGMTQSGASAALRRLREAIGDPLLVQVGQKLVPTDRALDLVQPLEQILADVKVMLDPPEFDPQSLERRFKLWTVDYVLLRMAERLLPKLKETAPRASVRFVDLSTKDLDISLGRGDADLAMVPLTVKPPESQIISSQFLFRDKFVAVVGINHPLASQEAITAEQVPHYRWIAFHSGIDDWGPRRQRAFAGYGPEISPVVQVQQLSTLPFLAASTDSVAITLLSAVEPMLKFMPLKILELPGEAVEQEIHLMWSAVHTQDIVHRWFRNLISEVACDKVE